MRRPLNSRNRRGCNLRLIKRGAPREWRSVSDRFLGVNLKYFAGFERLLPQNSDQAPPRVRYWKIPQILQKSIASAGECSRPVCVPPSLFLRRNRQMEYLVMSAG